MAKSVDARLLGGRIARYGGSSPSTRTKQLRNFTMRPYHPANIALTEYSAWQVIPLAWLAKFLGVQIKIGGLPFGSFAPTNEDAESEASRNDACGCETCQCDGYITPR